MRLPDLLSRACLAGFTLLCAAACGPSGAADGLAPDRSIPEPAAEAPVRQSPIVVMLGDSLTAGYQLPAAAALPAAVQRVLADDGVAARLVNAGVSGDTTADGLARYDFSVAEIKPDLLVLALGANDYLNGFPPERAKTTLAAIIERARKDDLPVALLGIVVPDGAGVVNAREADYAAIYPELAGEYDLPLLPNMLRAIAGKPEMLLPDGVHPTAAGVEAMAADIGGFLAPLVSGLAVDP